MNTVVVLTGGGLKAAVAAARYAVDHRVVLLHINHGQPSAGRERTAIRSLAETLAQSRVVAVDCPVEAQLAAEGAMPDTPGQQTPVSNLVLRGLMPMLLTVGVQGALRHGATAVVVALTRADDASPDGGRSNTQHRMKAFIHTFNLMNELWLPDGQTVAVQTPMLDLSVVEVVKLGRRLSLPFEHTWSCHAGGASHCGRCPGCQSRVHMFAAAHEADPLAALPTT